MARRKTGPELVQAKHSLAERLRKLRAELYGDRGGPELARRLGIPVRTWYNYESGVTVPAEVVLRLIELTAVEPIWLLNGQGPQYRLSFQASPYHAACSSHNVGDMLRTVVDLLESDYGISDKRRNGRPHRPTAGPDLLAKPLKAALNERLPFTPALAPEETSRSSPQPAQQPSCVRHRGDSMLPIVADGASVGYSQETEDPADLDGKLVVAWIDGEISVRWFHVYGRYGVLKAENASVDSSQVLIDLDAPTPKARVRRVLWISTPH